LAERDNARKKNKKEEFGMGKFLGRFNKIEGLSQGIPKLKGIIKITQIWKG